MDTKITLIVQGSYTNKMNILTKNDVDLLVILESIFITQYTSGIISSNKLTF